VSTAAFLPRRALASEALATAAVAAAVVVAYGLVTRIVPWASFQDDMQSQQIGVSREIARAVGEGTWPLVSPLSWNGGALAGEYQYGVFSPFRVALDFVAWSLRAGPGATALLLVSANLAVLAAGAFRLGRAMGLSRPAAALVAFAASLNGWVLVWGADWYPSLTSLAWLPWIPWALSRRGIARVVGAAVFTELAVAAGWPFTDVMVPLVVGWWLAREGSASAPGTRRMARIASGAGAVALGVALAAPALLCLRAFAPATLRAEMHGLEWVRRVPWSALPAMALPALRADWSGFDGGPRPSMELSCGGLVLGLVVAALVAHRRAFVRAVRWELGLVAVSAAVMLAPSLAPMRWSFRWLPLFHLALGLVAGQALDRLASDAADATGDGGRRLARNPGVLAAVLTLAVGALALALGAADPTTVAAVVGGWLALFALVALAWRRAPAHRAAWLAPIVTLLAQGIAMGAVDHPDNPQWAVDARALSPGPFHADRLYLGLTTLDAVEGDDFDGTLRPADVPMLAGLSFVNGYSAMKPRGVQARFGSTVQGYLWPDAIARALDEATRDDGLLARLGIDGLVVGRVVEQVPQLAVDARLAGAGWARVASLPAGSIWERRGAAHAVAWSPSLAVTPVSVGRDRIELDVSGDDAASGAEVVTRRAWYPGWAATLDGVPVPVEAYEGIVAAARLPPGAHGRLVMRYRPRGLREGAGVAAVALLLLAVLAMAERRRERATTSR
jgi:hypothetical protein